MDILKSKEVNYSSDENMISTYNNMYNMRKQQVLCDLNIKIGSKIIAVHKIVLASNSEYFNKMFTSDFKESHENEITINEVEPEALEHLVEYAYTSKLKITERNVQGLLVASSFLLFDHNIFTECLKFIKDIVNVENCFKFKDFAYLNDISELQEFCNSFMLENFCAISISSQFLLLTFDRILELIQSENINASEVKIYESIILWTKHDLNNRSKSLQKLMRCLRMSLIPASYIMNQMKNEDILNANCKRLVYNMLYAKGNMLSSNQFCIRGRNRSSDQLILCTSWFINENKFSINYISTKDDKLYPVNLTSLSPKHLHILSDGRVLCTIHRSSISRDSIQEIQFNSRNSISSSIIERELMLYDGRIKEWVKMPTSENFCGITEFVELNNHLYMLQDSESHDFTSYDMTGNNLTQVPKSSPRRFGHLVQSDGFIYCASDGERGCEMFQYNPITDVWFKIWHANKQIYYRYSTLCSLNGFIYIFGGKINPGSSTYFKSAWKFNISTRVWRQIADMNVGRADAGAVIVNGLIYVMGGCICNSISIYDPQTNKWTSSKHKIHSVSSYSCMAKAIIFKPESNINAENILDYYSNI